MSKLLRKYQEVKKEDSSYIYLFRIGIFYNIINDDAKFINKNLGLKITPLGPNIIKCGFPISKIEKYQNILLEKNIKFKIIDDLPSTMSSNDYINNIEINKILNYIIDIDMNNTTFQQAFNILLELQNKIKKI